MGGFDGESAFDLNDVWLWKEDENDTSLGTWSLVCDHAGWSGRDGHCAVVLHDSIFVLGGTDDPFACKCDVWSSLDGGASWNKLLEMAPWPERWQHAACVHTINEARSIPCSHHIHTNYFITSGITDIRNRWMGRVLPQ